ncbi:glycosyltransferase family 4 protein [Neobacillus sp. LXY-4]|uniref:glycosyltransferase family 4 protein n=1 Tax=Neobacillus sp. LXY-4 TaxID=3379826 RepID=UPI003EE01807
MWILAFALCFTCSNIITPLIKNFAIRINAIDHPHERKVHKNIMPRLGGLAIYISFMTGFLIVRPDNPNSIYIIIGSMLIILTGLLDDLFELPAKMKFVGQLFATLTVVIIGGIQVTFINLPFGAQLELGIFSIPLTIIWIVGITNAINLIDGLDGLAAGVCSIALTTITWMAFVMGDGFVFFIGLIMLGSTLGFLTYNFYPAKIFMGDTGALFLGYMISVLSLLGFKNVTFISFIIPAIILGVPISDTFYAIIRRVVNKKPIYAPDNSHLHHCLIQSGFSHRQTVLLIYAMSAVFSIIAIVFSRVSLWVGFTLIISLLFMIELFAEIIGLAGNNYRPIIKFFQGLRYPGKKEV